VLDADPWSRLETARLIEAAGGMVVIDSPPRPDSVALLRRMEPDAVVLAADDGLCGPGDTKRPESDPPAAIVLLVSATRGLGLRAARAPGVMGVLLRPLRPEAIRPILDVSVARFRELRRLRRALADRPVVEKAKGRLMAQGLTEPDAFGWLRRRAMERRVRIGDVARSVLESA
jgi:response regulator NasT